MRYLFLDESGISKHEPVAVVAGVFVDGDTQLIPLENCLTKLMRKHIPEKHHEGFYFHAKDIARPTKQSIYWNRDEWPEDRRYAILDDLVQVPNQLGLSIVYYYLEKERLTTPDGTPLTQGEIDHAAHTMVFTGCTVLAERAMRRKWSDEVAQMVAENNDSVRKAIDKSHALLRDKNRITQIMPQMAGHLPLQRIRGSVHFTGKEGSQALQIADTCAFVIARQWRGSPTNSRFFIPLKPNILPWSFDPETRWPYGPIIVSSPTGF